MADDKVATSIPPETEFTFSVTGPSLPARFYSTTPVTKPAQRLWHVTQARMRETPTAPPASPEIPVDIASRLIAPLRSKEQRNVERLENENAKFKHTILEILKSGERSEQLVTEQEVAIKKLREENASIRKLNLEAKMADEKRLEEQEAHIANLQKRNEAAEDKAVEIAANHLAAVMDELRSSNRNLELQNESLNADIDSMRVRLEAAEKRLTETSASYRHAQTTINNSNATISKFEHHIDEVQAKLENARQELGIKDSRIKAKDNDLSNTAAEVANLNSLNKELQVKNRRLISQNEKLELQAQHNNAEIDALRQASRDYLELESALAEAQTTITKVRDEIVSLEQSNAELRARAEEYTTFPRTRGTINNLESELSGSGFHGTDQDTLFTLNDDQDVPEAIASPEVTAPEESREVTVQPAVITSPEVTESPEATRAPVATSSSDLAQSPAVIELLGVIQTPVLNSSPDVIQYPATTEAIRVISPPVVILKSHNPLRCWLQVYLDLWILFVFWFNHRLTKSLGKRNTGSSSDGVVQDDDAVPFRHSSSSDADSPPAASGLGDVEFVMTTTARSSTDHLVPVQEPTDVWIKILALCLHALFYAAIIFCVTNYLDVLRERSIWLSANEITRQYFHRFYKAPSNHECGIFYELLGPVKFFDVLRYNVHKLVEINRSFPG